MSKRLTEKQKEFVAENIFYVKAYANNNSIKEDSEKVSELNYRFVHSVASFNEEKGDFKWYTDKGFERGIKSVDRKRKRANNLYFLISPHKLCKTTDFKKSTSVSLKRLNWLLDKAGIQGTERTILRLYYQKKMSKREISTCLFMTKYRINKMLEETKAKLHKLVVDNNLTFDEFLE